jgi:hypothetical protein
MTFYHKQNDHVQSYLVYDVACRNAETEDIQKHGGPDTESCRLFVDAIPLIDCQWLAKSKIK